MLSVQPSLLSSINGVREFVEENLSEERTKGINPLKKISDMGIKVCFNSDAPATDPYPIRWIHDACNNSNPEESVSVYEALKMATINGAMSCFDEKERGTLEMGKSCDLVVLDKNPYEIPTDELKTINVLELYLKGKPYKRSRTGSMATMLRGMFPQ